METVALDVDPYWTIALALLLDAILGRPTWIRAPIDAARGLITTAIDAADKRLNRENRTPADRRIRGAVVIVVFMALAYLVGDGLDILLASGFGYLIKAVIIASCLNQRGSFDETRRLLEPKDVEDPHAVRRVACAQLIRNFAGLVVAVAFAYAMFGLAGVFAYCILLHFANRLPKSDARSEDFGAPAEAILWAIAVLYGAAASAILVLASIFSPSGSPRQSLMLVLSGPGADRYGRNAWALAAAAGAFGFAFQGRDGWIGGGRAKFDAGDMRRILYFFTIACLLHLAGWTILGFLSNA